MMVLNSFIEVRLFKEVDDKLNNLFLMFSGKFQNE